MHGAFLSFVCIATAHHSSTFSFVCDGVREGWQVGLRLGKDPAGGQAESDHDWYV